jgi:hypothetical protein
MAKIVERKKGISVIPSSKKEIKDAKTKKK